MVVTKPYEQYAISTLFGISGGVEPIFANSYTRTTKSLSSSGDVKYEVYTEVIEELMEAKGIESVDDLPDYCVTSHDLKPIDRIKFQSVWQEYIDSAISSTVNLKEEATIEDIKQLYIEGYKHGLKGITVYRDNCRRVGILNVNDDAEEIGNELEEECST